mgnify:CR=1 FL=1
MSEYEQHAQNVGNRSAVHLALRYFCCQPKSFSTSLSA